MNTTVSDLLTPRGVRTNPISFAANREWRAKWLRIDETHPEVSHMAQAVENFTLRALSDDAHPRLLVIHGRNGVGKTTVATRALEAVRHMAVEAWYEHRTRSVVSTAKFPWSRLANTAAGDRTAENLWIDAIESGLVLLDDVGSDVDRYLSGLPAENLRLILEERKNKWTIVTTNVQPSNWVTVWDRRVEDRLHRNAVHVGVTSAPSYARTI